MLAGGESDRGGDLDLIQGVIEGDTASFRSFLARIDPIVRRCLANLRSMAPWSSEVEEDLRQHFELMLLEEGPRILGRFRHKSSLTTWIYVVATRSFRRHLKRIRTDRARLVDAETVCDAVDPHDSIETVQIHRADLARVRAEVRRLEEDERSLLSMLFEEERTAEDVGQMLGLTPSGVRMKKKRLLARIAERLLGEEE